MTLVFVQAVRGRVKLFLKYFFEIFMFLLNIGILIMLNVNSEKVLTEKNKLFILKLKSLILNSSISQGF